MAFANGEPADPADEQAKFFMHFGHFIWQYANVEKMCHFVFHRHSGVSEVVSRALIGGEQLSKVTPLLNVIIKAKGDIKLIEEMSTLVDQINVITQLRSNLIHRGADTRADGSFEVSNQMIAKTHEGTEILRLNLSHLKNATADLECISLRLGLLCLPVPPKSLPPYWSEMLSVPWRYKRVEPDRPFQPRRNIRQ